MMMIGLAESFVEELLKLFTTDVGCVFCNIDVVNLDKDQHNLIRHFRGTLATGVYENKILEKLLMKLRVISPGCCIFRKEDIIDALYLGRLPLKNITSYHGVGPDVFMMLLTLLKYSKFGYVDKTLANFGAHDGSITVNASHTSEKSEMINNSYNNLKIYYLGLQYMQKKWASSCSLGSIN